MYKLKLTHSIFNGDVDQAKSADFTRFEVDTELPFVPFVGLCLNNPNPNASEEFHSGPIEEIFWCGIHSHFTCYTESFKSGTGEAEGVSYQSLIEGSLEAGWKITNTVSNSVSNTAANTH